MYRRDHHGLVFAALVDEATHDVNNLVSDWLFAKLGTRKVVLMGAELQVFAREPVVRYTMIRTRRHMCMLYVNRMGRARTCERRMFEFLDCACSCLVGLCLPVGVLQMWRRRVRCHFNIVHCTI